MFPLALAVLGASLLGSVHCAAMCGAFTCLYAGTAPGGGAARAPLAHHAAYNFGRLVSYLTLGLFAGTIGAGLGGPAALVAGVLLVLWGGHALLQARGIRWGVVRVPAGWQRAMGHVVRQVQARPPVVRATVTGLVTTLLPCGWMWAFVAVAGGTGSIAGAMLVMTVFWLGTLPVMLAVGIGAQRLTGRFRERLPVVTAAVIVVLGLASIALHLGLLPGGGILHAVMPAVPGATDPTHVHGVGP
jgi:sulfite exporter TauE/SafE